MGTTDEVQGGDGAVGGGHMNRMAGGVFAAR